MSAYMRTLMLLVTVLSAGCGGSGGSNEIGSNQAPASKGVFVDAAVSGLSYTSPSHHGITDEYGNFQYQPGEMVSFSVGDIVIGEALGADIVTPLQLVAGANDENNPRVTNIIRFLQSLDSDGDLANGIVIKSNTHNSLTGQSLDFSLSVTGFEAAFNAISDAVLGSIRLIDVDAARSHFRNTLDQLSNGGGYTENPGSSGGSVSSKYPPAKPGALVL